jgi:F-type H+-transporting ATPase subunit delta
MESRVSKYASAIVSIAKDEKAYLKYKENLSSLLKVFLENIEIQKYLESYFVSDEEKFRLIDELTKPYKSENLSNFLKLLAKKHLIYQFKDIVKEVTKLLNEELDIDEGFVYSTEQLSPKQVEKIEEAIAKKLGKKVELKNVIDERLIGGVRVVIHDHVYDGSIKYKLETLKNNLKERRTN